ncbi:ABC transporter ATP-binding protein, partial [Synechococcus sp. R6-10]
MHPGRSYRRLIPFIRPHLWMLLLGLTCTLGFVLTMPALAYLIEWVARSIGAGDLGQLRMLALIGVVFFLVRGAF